MLVQVPVLTDVLDTIFRRSNLAIDSYDWVSEDKTKLG
jgi:hypothetical protein